MRRYLSFAAQALALAFTLGGCGGGTPSVGSPPGGNGGGSPPLPSSVTVSSGAVTGTPTTFSPAVGDASNAGQGQTIDGVPCLPTMDEAHYHVHVFLGFVVNGQMRALPMGTGMKNPGQANGGVITTASCFYYLHTHDAAGVVHIEDPSTQPRTVTLHTLGQYLDIWGHSLNGMTIYTSGAKYQGQGDQTISNTTYTKYSGDPRAIPLYAHEVIWAVSGSPAYSASQLPSVHFTY